VSWACGGPLSADEKPPLPSEKNVGIEVATQAVINNWSIATSEELQPVGCGAGNLINSMRCTGNYCDNVGIFCSPTTATFGDTIWKSYFSEEGTNNRTCDSGYWMTGLVCRGGNCDDVAIQCTRVSNRTAGSCRWADRTFSEEFPNTYATPAGWYARGLACSGSRCDNLRVYECQLN
jgi:hypothetical protein